QREALVGGVFVEPHRGRRDAGRGLEALVHAPPQRRRIGLGGSLDGRRRAERIAESGVAGRCGLGLPARPIERLRGGGGWLEARRLGSGGCDVVARLGRAGVVLEAGARRWGWRRGRRRRRRRPIDKWRADVVERDRRRRARRGHGIERGLGALGRWLLVVVVVLAGWRNADRRELGLPRA